jgi:hypothetical protein
MSKASSIGCVFGPSCTLAPMPTLKLKEVSNPLVSTEISKSNILRTVVGPEVDGKESSYSCIASNLGSPQCENTTLNLQNCAKAKPEKGNSNCIAFCPTNPASTNYATYKSSGSGRNQVWGWNQIEKNSITNNDTITKLNEPINYEHQGEPVTCSYTNVNSVNCKVMGDFAGCQAYCIPKDAPPESGFLIEQKCPDNKDSCSRTELVWNRK